MQAQESVTESVHELVSTSHARIEALKQRHSALSCEIEAAQKRPATTDFYLNQLKKQKLALKEEIKGIRSHNG